MECQNNVLFLVDSHSFPKSCPELQDLLQLLNGSVTSFDTESPTAFFRKAMELTESWELIVPITRNFYIRDRLRQEGVGLVICI